MVIWDAGAGKMPGNRRLSLGENSERGAYYFISELIGIHVATEEVKKMGMSERMRARYEAHMKEVRDRKAIEVYKREQGYKQGNGDESLWIIYKFYRNAIQE